MCCRSIFGYHLHKRSAKHGKPEADERKRRKMQDSVIKDGNDKGADGTCMKAAAYFSSQSVGEGSVDVLMKLINGEDVDMETAVDAEIVTPDNYKDVMGDAAN